MKKKAHLNASIGVILTLAITLAYAYAIDALSIFKTGYSALIYIVLLMVYLNIYLINTKRNEHCKICGGACRVKK